MIVHSDPDICWGIKPRESENLSIIARAQSSAGASAPRPQAGRGLFGVIMLLNDFSHSFRRRFNGEKERIIQWTMTIAISIVANRRGGGAYSYALSSSGDWLQSFSIFSKEMVLAKRRPLLVGFVR